MVGSTQDLNGRCWIQKPKRRGGSALRNTAQVLAAVSVKIRWGDSTFIEGGARRVLPHRCSRTTSVVRVRAKIRERTTTQRKYRKGRAQHGNREHIDIETSVVQKNK